jgi:serine kinase of HPr protein (carbohydrate metabolism regulator)
MQIHATGLVVGGQGVLLRGPSGAGKSMLALALLDRAETRGDAALLVSDDRVEIEADDARLFMLAPERIAGLIELRGRGIVRRPYAERAPVDLVVDLIADLPRMPEDEDLTTEMLGVTLARCPVPAAPSAQLAHQLLLVVEALRAGNTAV